MALYAFDGTGDNWDTAPKRGESIETQTKAFEQVKLQEPLANDRFATNVVLFAKEYNQAKVGRVEYFPGVGSGTRVDRSLRRSADFIFGGAFGWGAKAILQEAEEALRNNVANGDSIIDIIAYSRGAAIARIFVDKISADPTKYGFTQPPKIRFLGLFDTVASFGNPLGDRELLPDLLFQESLPDNVENAFHAMSRDLHRIGFGLDRAYGKNLLEVWFRGGHGDIGGNSKIRQRAGSKKTSQQSKKYKANRERTNITLKFMLRKAIAVGIKLSEPEHATDSKSPVVFDRAVTLNPLDFGESGADPSRQHTNTDIFHYTFFDEKNQQIGAEDVPYNLRYETAIIEDEVSEGKNYRLEIKKLFLPPESA